MSFPFAFPTDKITADLALAKFNDFASNFRFKEIFEAALRISFGPHYSIIPSHSRRMEFFCEACRKSMNCVSALMAHHVSGPHVKNVDMQIRNTMEETMISLTSLFPRDSLQYALACSQAQILGVHLIEGYVSSRRRSTATYFKCLLCGAHGKTEEILRHLKNDKHTDRFIKYHFQCKLSTFTPEVRESIRKQVAACEGIAINEIKTIMDRNGDLYPTRWEDEGLSEKKLLQKYARCENGKMQRSRASVSPSPSRSLPHSSSSSRDRHWHLFRHETVKTEESSSDRSEPLIKQEKIKPKVSEVSNTQSQSPLGVTIERDSGVSRNDQGVQVFTDWVSETCLKKLKFVVHTHSLNESRVMSQEDAQACLELMFSIGTLLQHSLYSAKDRCSNKRRLKAIATMRENVNKMQGYVKLIFSEHWNATNAPVNCLEETLTLWNLE